SRSDQAEGPPLPARPRRKLMDEATRELVRQRAGNRCEYCLHRQEAADRCACERSSRALSPATPRNRINRRTGLEERVVRALDAVHEAQGVERQRTLSRIV